MGKGRRHSGKKLEPPLPEARDELHLPRYFGLIRGGAYNKAEEERREDIPGARPKVGETPKAINIRPLLSPPSPIPGPIPEPERVPLIVRAARYITSILKTEPERPVTMPVVPELNYPALYTRYPVMKTVTKTTDSWGRIQVDFSHLFQEIPGVVMTIQGEDAWSGSVYDVTLTYFKAIFFKVEHDHGGTTDDGGLHTPQINADGNHMHDIEGEIPYSIDGKVGYLAISDYTNYEKGHKHLGVTSGPGTAHKHTNPNVSGVDNHEHSNPDTNSTNINHRHSIPATDGTDDTDTALHSVVTWTWCEACDDYIVGGDGFYNLTFALGSHYHLNTGKYSGWTNPSHLHAQGVTGAAGGHNHGQGDTGTEAVHTHFTNDTGVDTSVDGHRHQISDPSMYDGYITDITFGTGILWTSQYEDPYHDHSGDEVPVHDHIVALQGGVLLKNTQVTITYLAQVET